MPELTKSERLALAREQFKDEAIIEKGDGGDTSNGGGGRFLHVKTKSSQVGLTVTNSVTFKDQVTDLKYTVSVSAVISGKGAKAEQLADLQSYIGTVLSTVHENI